MTLGLLLAAWAMAAQVEPAPLASGPEGSGIERLDRLVAVVDDEPIFASELEAASRRADGDDPQAPRQRLDRLIDERVRAHEVDRHGTVTVRDEDVRVQLEGLPPGSLAGGDLEEAEALVRRQLTVLAYVEERLGALVFVSDDAVRAYYDGTLRERLFESGGSLPPFEEVEDAIRALLRQEALDRRIVTWTAELRERARIEIFLDETSPRPLSMTLDDLPPVSLDIGPGGATSPENTPWPPPTP